MTIGAGMLGVQAKASNVSTGGGIGGRVAVLASADTSFRQRVAETLNGLRWQVREARGGAEAIGMVEANDCSALLLDSWLPDLEVGELAAQMRVNFPSVDIVLADESLSSLETGGRGKSSRRNELLYALRQGSASTHGDDGGQAMARATGSSAVWVDAPLIKARLQDATPSEPRGVIGASDKPLTGAEQDTLQALVLSAALSTGVEALTHAVPAGARAEASVLPVEPTRIRRTTPVQRLPELVGDSPVMLELSRLVRLVAPRTTGVLIEGPTGSGKELVARAVHRLSSRVSKPMAVLNCAAIPEPLLEAELFGHTRGAFTGAVQARTGRVEAASGGTLFLDEIGEMPLGLQSKLLRFLESGELQRVGENDPVRVDVRVIAATNEHLLEGTRNGRFRADLYYRLAVFPIATPSLAEHAEDIPLLAAFFLSRMAESQPAKRLSAPALEVLMAHSWPGNVRELQHVIERAYILAEDRQEIEGADICIRQTAR